MAKPAQTKGRDAASAAPARAPDARSQRFRGSLWSHLLQNVHSFPGGLFSKIGTVALSGLRTRGRGLLLLCLFPVTSGVGGTPVLLVPSGFHLLHTRRCSILM